MSSFSRIASAALVAALGAASVRAHGIVTGVLVDGSTYYEAYNPFQDPYMNPTPERIVRKIPGNGEAIVPLPLLHWLKDFVGPVTDLSLIE